MAVNTRFSTGVHALVLLALEPGELQTSETIAGKLDTNPVVIRRVFSLLRQAELVVSHKGPSGGSQLARPAKEITLKDVYRAFKTAEAGMLEAFAETTLHTIAKRVSRKPR